MGLWRPERSCVCLVPPRLKFCSDIGVQTAPSRLPQLTLNVIKWRCYYCHQSLAVIPTRNNVDFFGSRIWRYYITSKTGDLACSAVYFLAFNLLRHVFCLAIWRDGTGYPDLFALDRPALISFLAVTPNSNGNFRRDSRTCARSGDIRRTGSITPKPFSHTIIIDGFRVGRGRRYIRLRSSRAERLLFKI